MRKLFCLLAALLLMLSCAGAEEAGQATETADNPETGQLDIFRAEDEDRIWITAAAQVSKGMLITSPALLEERTDNLVISDGQNEWKAEAVITDSSGLMAMIFFDAEKREPRLAAWPLMPYGDSAKVSTCLVRSGKADGGRTDCGVRNAASMDWKGCRCLLLDLEEEAPLGSAVFNAKGELIGMVAAGYAEGLNRVLALPAEEIARGMTEAGNLLTGLYSWGDPPEGFRVTNEKNFLTVDWSDMTLPEKKEGEEIYLVIADIGNDYLNFYPAEVPERKLQLILAPGRVYISGILASASRPSDFPEHYEVTVIPRAQQLTDYSFRPTLTAIAEMPEGAKEGEEPGPVTVVTEELLRSGRAYFYSASTYEVTERIPDKTLLVTLTDPKGNCYRYESSWVYAPEYMQEDIWYISLTETGLTYSLDQDGYPHGEYQMAYYVDGDLADAFTFELK